MIGLENKVLRSENLTYRLLEPGDRAALGEMLRDGAVTRPAGFAPLTTPEALDDFFANLTRHNTGVAILREDALVGYIHVNRYAADDPAFRDRRCVSTGFVIGAAWQRRGYGSETLACLTEYLKGRFDFCFASHFEGNEASRRTILRCGYRYFDRYPMEFDIFDGPVWCLEYVK